MGAEWLALGIPLLSILVMYLFFRDKIVWWEVSIPIASTVLFILIFKVISFYTMTSDTEYRGYVIVKAEYYEYWETWVKRTCSRQVACGQDCTTDSQGKTTCTTKYCTEYYDCSYCDKNSAYWVAIDNRGVSYGISEDYYNQLKSRWNSKPRFVELNRDIEKHGGGFLSRGCGKDGDMYDIFWDRRVETADAAVVPHGYRNYIQASHSAFKMPYVDDEEAKSLGLYKYPERYYPYKQHAVLGLEKVVKGREYDTIQRMYEYFNGYFGSHKHVKTFITLFPNKLIDISFKQAYYWDGANDNELVVAIGYDSVSRKLDWVRAFGWADNKRIFVEIRENLMELDTLDLRAAYPILSDAVNKYWKPKDFEDFSYISVDLTSGQLVWIWIITSVITLFCVCFAIFNEIDPE